MKSGGAITWDPSRIDRTAYNDQTLNAEEIKQRHFCHGLATINAYCTLRAVLKADFLFRDGNFRLFGLQQNCK